MNNLVPIEHKEQRVITTRQLAEVYETDEVNIRNNYSRNRDKFTEGTHYFLLKGEDLQAFKNSVTQSYIVDKRTPSIILWTERGASRHCKILDTNKAWEQFDNLESTYFRIKEYMMNKFEFPTTLSEALRLAADIQREKEMIERQNMILWPKGDAYDLLIDANGALSLKGFANSMNWGRNRLSKLLREKEIFMDGCALPYQRYINSGYFKVKDTTGRNGEIYSYSLVTPKGVDYIVRKVREWGLLDELLDEGRRELALV